MLPSWKELVAFSAQVATLQEAEGGYEVGLRAEGSTADLAPFVIQPSQAADQLLQQLLLTPVYTSVLQPEPTLLCPDSVTGCTPDSRGAGPTILQSRGTLPPGSSPPSKRTRGPVTGGSHQLANAQALHPRGESAAAAGRAAPKPVAQIAGNPANALPYNTTATGGQAPGSALQQQQYLQHPVQLQQLPPLGPAAAEGAQAEGSGWAGPEELLPAPLAASHRAANSTFLHHNSTLAGGRAANGTPAPHAGVQPVAGVAGAPASLAPGAAPARKAPKDGLKHLIQLHQQEQAKKKKREQQQQQQQQQQKPPKRRRLQGGAGVAAGVEPGAMGAGAGAGPVAEQRVHNGAVQVLRERGVGGEGGQGAWGQGQGPAGEGDGDAGGEAAAAGLREPDAAGGDDYYAAEGFCDDMDLADARGVEDGEENAAGGHAPAGLGPVGGARDPAEAVAGALETQDDSAGANGLDTDDDDLPLAQLVGAGGALEHGTHGVQDLDEGTRDQQSAEPAHADTGRGLMEPGQQGVAPLSGAAPPRRAAAQAAAAGAAAAAARGGAAGAARARHGAGGQQLHVGAESLQPAFREGGPNGGGGLAGDGSGTGGQEGAGEGAVGGAGNQGLEDQPLVPIVKVRPHRELSALASVSLASLVSVGAAAGAGARTRAAGGGRGAPRQGQGAASGSAIMGRTGGQMGNGGRGAVAAVVAGDNAVVVEDAEDEEDEAYARAAAARLGAVLGGEPRHVGRGTEAAAGVPGATAQGPREAQAAATAAAQQQQLLQQRQHADDWAAAIAAGFDDDNDLPGAVVPPSLRAAPGSGGLGPAGGAATAAVTGASGPRLRGAAMPGGGTASGFRTAALAGPVAEVGAEAAEAAAALGDGVAWRQPPVQAVEDQEQYGQQQQEQQEVAGREAQEEDGEPGGAGGGQVVGGGGARLDAAAGADVDSEAEAEEGEASDASAGSGLGADGGEGWWIEGGGGEGAVGDAAAQGSWWAAGDSQLQGHAGAGGKKGQQRGTKAQARGRGRGKKGGAGRGAGDMAGPEAPGSGGRQAQPKRKRQQQQQQQQQQRQGQQQQRQPKAPPQHVEVGLYADVKAFQRQQRVARARAGGADPDSATRPVAEIRETPVCRFWRLGRCAKGAACAFPHTGEPVTRLVPCRFWRQGRCSRGDACPFSHDPATPEPCQEALQAGGTCAAGPDCPLGHYGPEDTDALRTYYEDSARAAASRQQQQQAGASASAHVGPGTDGDGSGAPAGADVLVGSSQGGGLVVNVSAGAVAPGVEGIWQPDGSGQGGWGTGVQGVGAGWGSEGQGMGASWGQGAAPQPLEAAYAVLKSGDGSWEDEML